MKVLFDNVRCRDWEKVQKAVDSLIEEIKNGFGALGEFISSIWSKLEEERCKEVLLFNLDKENNKLYIDKDMKKKIIALVFSDLQIRTYRLALSKRSVCNIVEKFLENKEIRRYMRSNAIPKLDIFPIGIGKYEITARGRNIDTVYECVEKSGLCEFKFIVNRRRIRKKKLKLIKLANKVYRKLVFKKIKYGELKKTYNNDISWETASILNTLEKRRKIYKEVFDIKKPTVKINNMLTL